MARRSLVVKDFGPIGKVKVPFADVTVLVGPQATGKSLVLQWLKLAIDRNRVLGTLGKHGYEVDGDAELLAGWYFGAGYAKSIRRTTKVTLGAKALDLRELANGRRRSEAHQALYVPAHRALVVGSGWPLNFRGFNKDTPFVVRDFSELLRELLGRIGNDVFPAKRRLRAPIRKVLDTALFHGGRVVVESRGFEGEQLRLIHGETRLSLMEWTTGQREALPLLAGLYEALPSGGSERREPIKWVIVEEPELGLHPDAILAVILLLFEVSRRGYRLVISTHSPLVLDVLWAMQQLRKHEAGPKRLLSILRARAGTFMLNLASTALARSVSVVYLDFKDGRVVSHDISGLDPLSVSAAERDWGGLLRHNTRIADEIAAIS